MASALDRQSLNATSKTYKVSQATAKQQCSLLKFWKLPQFLGLPARGPPIRQPQHLFFPSHSWHQNPSGTKVRSFRKNNQSCWHRTHMQKTGRWVLQGYYVLDVLADVWDPWHKTGLPAAFYALALGSWLFCLNNSSKPIRALGRHETWKAWIDMWRCSSIRTSAKKQAAYSAFCSNISSIWTNHDKLYG